MRVVRCPARNSMCAAPVVRPRPPWQQTLSGPCMSEPPTQTTCNTKVMCCYTHLPGAMISYSSYCAESIGKTEGCPATPATCLHLPPSTSFLLILSLCLSSLLCSTGMTTASALQDIIHYAICTNTPCIYFKKFLLVLKLQCILSYIIWHSMYVPLHNIRTLTTYIMCMTFEMINFSM